jgi:hypothetical protein
MTSKTRLDPKLPTYYPNGGGATNMNASLDELHTKEMAALLAKHEYEVHSLKQKHNDKKASASKRVAAPTRKKK